MKGPIAAAIAVNLAAGLFLLAQETPRRDAPPPCNLASIENRPYCSTCGTFPAEAEMENGVHLKDKTKVEMAPACIKTSFPCKQHGDAWVQHSRRCCHIGVTDCCIETTTLSRVEYLCEICLRRGKTERDVVHSDTGHGRAIVRTCEKSGLFPHGGTEYPAFGTPPTR